MTDFPTLCVVNYEDELPQRKLRYTASPRTRQDVNSSFSDYEYTFLTSPPTRPETTVPYRLSAPSSSSKPKTSPYRSDTSFYRDNETVQSQPALYGDWIIKDRSRTTQTAQSLPSLRNGWGDTSHTVSAETLDRPKWNKFLDAWVSGNQDDEQSLYFRFNHSANLYDRGRYHYVPEFDEFPHLPCPRFHAHMTKTPAPKQFQKKKKKILKPPDFWHYRRKEEPPPPPKPKRKPVPPPRKSPEPIKLPSPVKPPTPLPPTPISSSDSEEEIIPPDIKDVAEFKDDVEPILLEQLDTFSVGSLLDDMEDALEILDYDAPREFIYDGKDDYELNAPIRVHTPVTKMEPPPPPPQKLPPPPKIPTPPPPTPPPPTPPREPTPPPKPKKKKEIVKKEKKPPKPPPKPPTPPPPTPPPPKEPTPPPPPLPSPPPPPELPELPEVQPRTVEFKIPVKQRMEMPKIESPPPPTPTPTPPPSPKPKKKKPDWSKRKARLMYDKMKKKEKPPVLPPKEDITYRDYGWLAQFCILKNEKVEMYRRAFEACDEDENGYLDGFETILALKGIAGANNLTETEEEYIYTILEMADYKILDGTDFRLFAIVAALTQRIARLDGWMKNIINRLDFKMLNMKMFKAKDLFLWNVDQNTNKISIQQLMIELKAGGVSEEHQEEVQVKLGHLGALDLLDFMTYVPLFIMLHESVVENPLDDSRDK